MCSPEVAAVATVASTGYSIYSQQQQAEYQADVAEYNAAVAANEAQEVINEGVEAENIQRRKTAELLSKQRAQLGAANIDLSSGSALKLQQDTELLGETDALRIRSSYESSASALESESDYYESSASAIRSSADAASIGTLLSGVSGVARSWYTPTSAASIS